MFLKDVHNFQPMPNLPLCLMHQTILVSKLRWHHGKNPSTKIADISAMICNPEGESHSLFSLSPLCGSLPIYHPPLAHNPLPPNSMVPHGPTCHPMVGSLNGARLCHFLYVPLGTLSTSSPTHHKTKRMEKADDTQENSPECQLDWVTQYCMTPRSSCQLLEPQFPQQLWDLKALHSDM
jgi:hypothetical protein